MIEIIITGFWIHFVGDPSVGIFSQDWQVKGYFLFEDKAALEDFREKLKTLWEDVSDSPLSVETFEERKAWMDRENAELEKQK